MKLIVDEANIDNIRMVYEYYPVSGVTTNPSLLSREHRDTYSVLREIRDFIGEDELHVQVLGKTSDLMLREAEHIRSLLGESTHIKIPVTKEGLKAIKLLASEGANVTATCIYNAMQGLLAGLAGASCAAVYVNRIDDLCRDGVGAAKTIEEMYRSQNIHTYVLGASFRNCEQVIQLLSHGIRAVTVPTDVLKKMLGDAAVESAVEAFSIDMNNSLMTQLG